MGFVAQSQSAELVASRHDGCGRGMVTSGIAIIVAAPLVAGLVGAIGFAIGVYFALFEANGYNLDFSAARLSGLIAGMVEGRAGSGLAFCPLSFVAQNLSPQLPFHVLCF